MTDDAALVAFLEAARVSGAKVVAVGDPRQLSSVGPGGRFEAVVRRFGGVVHVLSENVRQVDPAERTALAHLRSGKVDYAVSWYAGAGRIAVSPDRDTALDATVAGWAPDLASRDNAAPPRDGGASISGVTAEPVAVRRAGPHDLSFLQEMLYDAADRPREDWPDFEASINENRNRRFWLDWPRKADIGVIAERNGARLGAAWIRRFEGQELGPLDDPDVPVLAIGVVRDHRGHGVGGALMDDLIVEARRSGVSKIALSTGLFNEAALRLYRRHGFNEVARRGDGVRMVAVLGQQHT